LWISSAPPNKYRDINIGLKYSIIKYIYRVEKNDVFKTMVKLT
jgi:hypothetical protein